MSDLTDDDRAAIRRAYWVADGVEPSWPPDDHPAAVVWLAGLRAGAKDMRERAAKACEGIGKDIVCPDECAVAIRALPLTEDK